VRLHDRRNKLHNVPSYYNLLSANELGEY
jgi:hypothetical protein